MKAPWAGTTKGPRTKHLNMRMSKAELAQLQALAEHHGVSRAEMIRMLLRLKSSALPGTGMVRS